MRLFPLGINLYVRNPYICFGNASVHINTIGTRGRSVQRSAFIRFRGFVKGWGVGLMLGYSVPTNNSVQSVQFQVQVQSMMELDSSFSVHSSPKP